MTTAKPIAQGSSLPCPQDIIVSHPLVITTEITIADYINRHVQANLAPMTARREQIAGIQGASSE